MTAIDRPIELSPVNIDFGLTRPYYKYSEKLPHHVYLDDDSRIYAYIGNPDEIRYIGTLYQVRGNINGVSMGLGTRNIYNYKGEIFGETNDENIRLYAEKRV